MWFFGFGSVRTRVLLLSLCFLGTGAWMIAPTWNAGELVDCNLAQLCAGTLPKSNWVRVRGRLLWDEAGIETGRYGRIRAYFVPLVPGNWNDNQPVHVIVRISEFDEEKMRDAVTVEGLIQPLGLPFDLRIAFSGDDGPQTAENVVYIHHGTNPKSQRQFAQVVLAIGFAGLIGFVVISKLGGNDAETTYHSLAQPRNLNEAVQRTTEEEQQHQERESQRESEVDRWMRERGLKKACAEEESTADAHETAAAS
jgi:hypothetical protein